MGSFLRGAGKYPRRGRDIFLERTTKAGAITGSLTGVLSFALFYFGGFFNAFGLQTFFPLCRGGTGRR